MFINNQKLITCVLPKGICLNVIKLLKEEKGIITANVNTARGLGKLTPLAYRGVGEQSEKEILTVTVASEAADEIFGYIYDEAKIDRPHGGLIYMSSLDSVSPYSLPKDLPEEE
ncbi:MAG: nitrogen regulatory protein PII [Gammaproteobacteria bacterium]|jgi:nitrogen regulatory protein PII